MRDDLEGVFRGNWVLTGCARRSIPSEHYGQKLGKEGEMAAIGTRLSISSYICTILYIGPVKGTTGTWWGVEWDDPSRGKHSGSHDGHKYFSTRYSSLSQNQGKLLFMVEEFADDRVPGAGSFIRPGKKTDGETTFLDALRGKYAATTEYERIVLDSSGKEIEMIGFDKVERQQRYAILVAWQLISSNLQELAIVVLDSMLIRYSNLFSEIQNTCPRITSLDLSRNLLSNLSTVAEICRPLEELRTLRLTGNRFTELSLDGELSNAFEGVEWLALNMCALSWDEVFL